MTEYSTEFKLVYGKKGTKFFITIIYSILIHAQISQKPSDMLFFIYKFCHLGSCSIGIHCNRFYSVVNHLSASAFHQTTGNIGGGAFIHLSYSGHFNLGSVDSCLQSDHYIVDHWQISEDTIANDSLGNNTRCSAILI